MTNHTDKELLDLAARAAGYDIGHPMNSERQEMIPPVLGFVTYLNGELQSTLWNPLDDDGQALRLAVKMRFKVDIRAGCITVELYIFNQDAEATFEFFADDDDLRSAATRRAIVRAAAAIGEKL